ERAGGIARRRLRQAVQSVSAHEADHAAEDSRQPGLSEGGGHGRSGGRGESAPRRRAHGASEMLTKRDGRETKLGRAARAPSPRLRGEGRGEGDSPHSGARGGSPPPHPPRASPPHPPPR